MTEEEANLIYEQVLIFTSLDNQLESAKEYAHWLLLHMELSWRGRLIHGLVEYLREPRPVRTPRKCIKVLRVLHEMTTHCTKVDLRRLVLTTELLALLRRILATSSPQVRGTINCCCLALLSNVLCCGWRMRDAVVESGLLKELLALLTEESTHWCGKGQVLWLLYQVLRYKVPGPQLSAILKIAHTLPVLLQRAQDVELLLPVLQLVRLISEYQSAMVPAMIKSKLLRCVLRYVLSPLPQVQREVIFILANVCQEYRARQHHYRFPKSILLHVHGLVRGACTESRVLVLQLLGGIIDNRCIKLDYVVELGLLKKIVYSASKLEPLLQVRITAGWTLVSMGLHLCHCYLNCFIDCGALHAICDLLHLELPVQLLRNILVVFFLLGERHCQSRQYLLHVMWECRIWPMVQSMQNSPNAAVSRLAISLTMRLGSHIYLPDGR